MFIRNCGFGLLAALLMFCGGCSKSTPEKQGQEGIKKEPAAKPTMAESTAQVHWLGMKQLLAETNATTFKTLWELPETARLLSQTLDKLALAPWRQSIPALQRAATNYTLLITNYPSLVKSNAFASVLRPMLEDLVQEESYLEVRPRTNGATDMILAVRLNDERSAAWQSNLLAIAENLTGTNATQIESNRWSLDFHPPSSTLHPRILSFSHSGAWTLLSLCSTQSTLLSDLNLRIQAQSAGNPFEPRTTNFWLEAHLDLQRLWPTVAQKISLPIDLPQASLTWIGDGKDVQTRGTFTFSKPLPFMIEPWNIPTNLLREPLDSSTGLQGLRPWLASLGAWKDLNLGEPPNQLFCWGRLGIPFHSYCAAPMTNADEALDKIRGRLLAEGNKWLATNATGYFEKATNGNALLWKVVPFMAPIIASTNLPNGSFLVAGFAPITASNSPPSAETLHGITSRTNLLYYDWELTGPRIGEWLYNSQLLRVIFYRPQFSRGSASTAWIKTVGENLKESQARSALAKTRPEELSFARSAALGLTAPELHLLLDWLESPSFPCGLQTLSAKGVNPNRAQRHPAITNAPALNRSVTNAAGISGK